MPNLFNRVADNAVASVGQTRILPAQHECDFSSELCCALSMLVMSATQIPMAT
jgi:hypothetical protein